MDCQSGLQDGEGEPVDSSGNLSLAQLVGRVDLWFKKKLIAALEASGQHGFNTSDILTLANLNCGRTYPSELARRIGVSRQAVYKLLKNLEKKEIVTLETDLERRNSKVIIITPKGELMIRGAVETLQAIETDLRGIISSKSVDQLRVILEKDWGSPE